MTRPPVCRQFVDAIRLALGEPVFINVAAGRFEDRLDGQRVASSELAEGLVQRRSNEARTTFSRVGVVQQSIASRHIQEALAKRGNLGKQ